MFSLIAVFEFHWTDSKSAFLYVCQCHSCQKRSIHLSYSNFSTFDSLTEVRKFEIQEGKELDELFFYSVPTSLFSIDYRVPRGIRELLTEAEGCLKSNFLTGASACARKLVYELAVREKAEGDDYDARIKSLKQKRPDVDPTYFDTLVTIQEVTSEKVHESSYDGWNAKHLRLILSTLRKVLQQMYVLPAVREDDRKQILALKNEILKGQDKSK